MNKRFLNYFVLAGIFQLSNSNVVHSQQTKCQRRTYFRDSFVCVCNEKYCDEVEEEGKIPDSSTAIVYSTSLESDRLTKSVKRFGRINRSKFDQKKDKSSSSIQIKIDAGKKFQKLIGFGGAITDAAMKVFNDVKTEHPGLLAKSLFDQYYGPTGISYNLGRVPIASCDFSVTNYSYLEKAGDFELESFSLSQYEFNRWEFLAKAQNVSNPPLRLFSSPWSAPAWIKTNGQMQGGGFLIGGVDSKYGVLYSKYFVRFFEEYAKRGVKFWATTIENEPGMAGGVSWQSMQFSSKDQKEFVQKHLGPRFKQNWATKDLKIMVHDNFRGDLYSEAQNYYKGDTSYIDGMAFHWYGGGNYDKVNSTYHLNPNKFLLSTEACNAYSFEHEPQLGDWQFAQNYAHDIIQTLLNGGSGWTDWNIFLDEQGGPNWVGNFVDAPIIVNSTGGAEFYKQPMYYIMGHFSKFVLPDSIRIDTQVDNPDDQLEVVAFERDDKIVVVLLNRSPDHSFNLSLSNVGNPSKQLKIELSKKSIKTVIWNK